MLMYPSCSDRKRCEIAFRAALDLIPIFEAESLWQAAESARALMAALQDWEIDSAWNCLSQMELACSPWSLSRLSAVPLQEHLLQLTAALRSVSADLLAPAELNLHN